MGRGGGWIVGIVAPIWGLWGGTVGRPATTLAAPIQGLRGGWFEVPGLRPGLMDFAFQGLEAPGNSRAPYGRKRVAICLVPLSRTAAGRRVAGSGDRPQRQ